MSKFEAEKKARQMLLSGYRHHAYEDEQRAYGVLFQRSRAEFEALLHSDTLAAMMERYLEVLGPTRMRAMQNSMICVISGVCRMAIAEGVNAEFSFALSDYYIGELEKLQTETQLMALLRQILSHYYDLIAAQQIGNFSRPVAAAIRFIRLHLYDNCTVRQVAEAVHLDFHYFSALFSKEVGMPPSRYILRGKLEEARRMMEDEAASVTETAGALGFYDIAHFSRAFKCHFGIPPSAITRRDSVYSAYAIERA